MSKDDKSSFGGWYLDAIRESARIAAEDDFDEWMIREAELSERRHELEARRRERDYEELSSGRKKRDYDDDDDGKSCDDDYGYDDYELDERYAQACAAGSIRNPEYDTGEQSAEYLELAKEYWPEIVEECKEQDPDCWDLYPGTKSFWHSYSSRAKKTLKFDNDDDDADCVGCDAARDECDGGDGNLDLYCRRNRDGNGGIGSFGATASVQAAKSANEPEVKETYVAGIYYNDNAAKWLAVLDEKATVTAVREPDNPYDANAICLQIGDVPAGHFPAKLAADLAPIMDAGGTVEVLDYSMKRTKRRKGGVGLTVTIWYKVAEKDSAEQREEDTDAVEETAE